MHPQVPWGLKNNALPRLLGACLARHFMPNLLSRVMQPRQSESENLRNANPKAQPQHATCRNMLQPDCPVPSLHRVPCSSFVTVVRSCRAGVSWLVTGVPLCPWIYERQRLVLGNHPVTIYSCHRASAPLPPGFLYACIEIVCALVCLRNRFARALGRETIHFR